MARRTRQSLWWQIGQDKVFDAGLIASSDFHFTPPPPPPVALFHMRCPTVWRARTETMLSPSWRILQRSLVLQLLRRQYLLLVYIPGKAVTVIALCRYLYFYWAQGENSLSYLSEQENISERNTIFLLNETHPVLWQVIYWEGKAKTPHFPWTL